MLYGTAHLKPFTQTVLIRTRGVGVNEPYIYKHSHSWHSYFHSLSYLSLKQFFMDTSVYVPKILLQLKLGPK